MACEARRRSFAGDGLQRLFACRALNGPAVSAWLLRHLKAAHRFPGACKRPAHRCPASGKAVFHRHFSIRR